MTGPLRHRGPAMAEKKNEKNDMYNFNSSV